MIHRRFLLGMLAAFPVTATAARAAAVREITWDDLIPVGVDYSEIIAEFDPYGPEATRLPKFDENAYKLVEALNGQIVKIPGYIIPLDYSGKGVTEFILAPYVGACIHVPPPPPNQLVFVNTDEPYPNDKLFDAIWVTGEIRTQTVKTDLAEIGYGITAHEVEEYVW